MSANVASARWNVSYILCSRLNNCFADSIDSLSPVYCVYVTWWSRAVVVAIRVAGRVRINEAEHYSWLLSSSTSNFHHVAVDIWRCAAYE